MRPNNFLEPGLWRFKGNLWLPSATAVGDAGLGPPRWVATSLTGSANPAATNFATSLVRNTFGAAVNGTECGVRLNNTADFQYRKGQNAADKGGFFFATTFVITTWATDNGGRIFAGLSNSLNPQCLNDLGALAGDLCGLYHDTADGANTFNLVVRDGTTPTKVAFNAFNGGPTLASGQGFRFEMWSYPNTTNNTGKVYARLTSLNAGGPTGTLVGYAETFLGPRNDIMCGLQVGLGVASAAAYQVDIASVYGRAGN